MSATLMEKYLNAAQAAVTAALADVNATQSADPLHSDRYRVSAQRGSEFPHARLFAGP